MTSSDGEITHVNKSSQHEYSAGLRVISETMRLAELTALLGEPSTSHDIGDLVSRRSPDGTKRKHAHWGLDAQVARTRPLDEHIETLVAFAESNRDTLRALRPHCVRLDIFCGVFAEPGGQGGWEMSPELMRRLVDLELTVGFDLY